MTRCSRTSVSLILSLVTLYDHLAGRHGVNGEIKIQEIDSVKIVKESDLSHESKDDYLIKMDVEERRNLCIRLRNTWNFAFPRQTIDFYVPRAHYYHFGAQINDNWTGIRCPFIPMFYVSRGRIKKKKPPVWHILKMPIKINFSFELESAEAATMLSSEYSSPAVRRSDLSNIRMNERFEYCWRAATISQYGFSLNNEKHKFIGELRVYEFDYTDCRHEFVAFACPTTPSMYLRLSDFDLLSSTTQGQDISEIENEQRRRYKNIMTIVILENEKEGRARSSAAASQEDGIQEGTKPV